MQRLREEIAAAVKAASRRKLSQEEIESVIADYAEDAAELEFRRKKLDQELMLLRWFVLAALISPPLLFCAKILIAALKLNVDLPEFWIMFIWALSTASGINSGYRLVKLEEYLPGSRRQLDEEDDDDEELEEDTE